MALSPQELQYRVEAVRTWFMVCFAFAWYDHLITLPFEYRFVWRRKPTVASVLYFLNRYVFLAASIYEAVRAHQTFQTCDKSFLVVPFTTVILVLVSQLVLLVRIYSLSVASSSSRHILMYGLGLIVAASFALMCAASTQFGASTSSCIPYEKTKFAKSYFIMPFVVDGILFGATTLFAYKNAKSSHSHISKTGINFILFKQGLIYFVVISLFNLLNVAMAFQGEPTLSPLFTVATLSATTISIARLMMCLVHDVNNDGNTSGDDFQSKKGSGRRFGSATNNSKATSSYSSTSPHSGSLSAPPIAMITTQSQSDRLLQPGIGRKPSPQVTDKDIEALSSSSQEPFGNSSISDSILAPSLWTREADDLHYK